MTLIEALKTGRRIRNKVWSSETFCDPKKYTFDYESVLADDWEVEEEPKKKETKTAEISPEVVDAVIAFAAFVEKLIKIDEDKE